MQAKKNKLTSGWKLSEGQKAEIIVRLANGETNASLAREYGISPSSVTLLAQRRKVSLKETQEDILTTKKGIIKKGLKLAEKYIDEASKEDAPLKVRMDVSGLSKLLNDLWKQTQVEDGKPTDITVTNINELKVSLEKKLILLGTTGNLLLGNSEND